MPSLSHTSDQSAGETWSPYHWCTSSCRTTGAERTYSVLPSVSIVWVSMALCESVSTMPSVLNG